MNLKPQRAYKITAKRRGTRVGWRAGEPNGAEDWREARKRQSRATGAEDQREGREEKISRAKKRDRRTGQSCDRVQTVTRGGQPVELKKQSSCSVRLSNKSNEYVAFKVKTTSPKRYCVRPNTGVIMPRSTCDFTVTMQAQRSAPPDMQLKDKFLVQSTVVPFGSTDEDITTTTFLKESGNFIEEFKLRVILVSPPHSPVLQPSNGASKLEAADESPRLKPASVFKESPIVKEASSFKNEFSDDKNFDPSHAKEVEELNSKITVLESKLSEAENAEDLKSKMNTLQSKLAEADKMIATLREEKAGGINDRDLSQQEIILLRRKAASKVQAGFPTFFVVFIWLVGIVIGYLLRS